jgi:hypothetical protein
LLERAQDAEVAAARTPVGLGFAFEILDRQTYLAAVLGGASGFHCDRRYAHGLLLIDSKLETAN